MNIKIIDLFKCPQSGQALYLKSDSIRSEVDPNEVIDGWLITKNGDYKYPIRNGIPRFVPKTNYADSFGMQWNKFAQTQL